LLHPLSDLSEYAGRRVANPDDGRQGVPDISAGAEGAGPEWKELADVIHRAMQKEVKDRFPDVRALRLALKKFGP
jgi:hypothetical protein